ncbi:MAG: sulfatase-like hydrolase/transferase [Clostridia bacterium]|nr:sulfatase-like hydrolase/transferase [Clostridia bacterium]
MKKNVRVLLREIFADILFFASLLSIDVSFRIIYEENNAGLLPSSAAFWASFFWCLLLVGISVAMPRVIRMIYTIGITLIFSVLALVHAVMDSFFGQYMSFSSVMFADDGAGYFEWSYFDVKSSLIVVLCICLVSSIGAAILIPRYNKHNRTPLICGFVAVALGVSGTVITVNETFKNDFGGIVWNSAKSHADYYDDFSDYRLCMHMCGLYHYTFRDAYISTGLKDTVDRMTNRSRINELNEFYSSRVIDPDNEMTGVFKGKDLILIQLESIDSWMVNDVAMPTLSALREESVDFTGFYAPKYLWAATFSSENAVNTGMITPMNSSKMAYFTETSYPDSLPKLFREAGYSANSYHRSNRDMYNRGEIHEAWGYEKYNSSGDMALSDGDMDSTIIEAYEMITPDSPYLSFIITYTGHGPYTAEGKPVIKHEEYIRSKFKDKQEDEYVWALCHAYETDLFVKNLYESLEAEGRLENTVLFFYTDHYDHYVTTEGLLEECKGTDDTNLMGNVPCFMYTKGIEPQKVDKVISTYDILPTLVNLFDLDCDGRYYLGNDAFSSEGGYVIFRDMSWYDGETYFNIKKDKPNEFSRKRSEEIEERLDACWDSIKFNYFEGK